VYPEEVEAVLKQHPAIADALVVGIDDEQYGQRVAAVISLSSLGDAAPTLEGLQQHARTALAGYKLPRALTIVDAIPRSPAGKGDYVWAKEQATRRS
jgi:acyl-CoA synthetase (AMP-forming)/AMP-acid ligase II